MKMNLKLIILGCGMALPLAATASVDFDLRGTTMQLDTIFHAKVGPGTTQTQLRLTGSNSLDVFYLTIDKTTPGVSIRSVCATDKVAGNARTSAMAQSKSKDGLLYFAGSNADFYWTSGKATNGSSQVGTPTAACTVDREIYKTSNSNYQFSVDINGIARVSRLNYYTGTATIGDKVTLFKGVNVGSPNNGITLYTPRYWGSTNQTDYTGNSYEVTARLVDGDHFYAGGKFRLEVTSEPNTSGDTPVPADGFVIFGRGTSTTGCNTGAMDFVGALKPGDIVEFDNITLTAEGERIEPVTVVSGNPKNVGGGATLDTEGERGDASARHPRTSIGVSADGTKIIMMVIDGRTPSSAGVTTSMLADVMRWAGAAEAVNLDGGGSSTLYTAALGVRNHCSDGQERAVGNAIFAVLEAEEDNEVAELQFRDWVLTMPNMGLYTPHVYAYNKHGVMISDDFKDYTLSCPASLGEITADGKTLFATGTGTQALTVSYGNAKTASIAITVGSTLTEASPRYSDVVLDNKHPWSVEVVTKVASELMPIAPGIFDWSIDDTSVATIDETGLITPVANGKAVVTGRHGDIEIKVNISVENTDKQVLPIDLAGDVEAWKVTQSGISNYKITPLENGFGVDYTIKSTRGTRLTLNNKINVFGIPTALRARVNPGDVKLTSVMFSASASGERVTNFTYNDIESGKENVIELPVSEMGDPDNIGTYPIEFSAFQFNPSGSAGKSYHIDITGLEAVYDNSGDGVDDIIGDNSRPAAGLRIDGDRVILSQRAEYVEVYDAAGKTVVSATDTESFAAPDAAGIYVARLVIGGKTLSIKFAK